VLAVLFDLLALWPLYLFARKMAGERAAWFAMLFFSLSAIHVIFSQMVRMYTLLALLVLLSFYLFWRIMQTLHPTWPLLIGYVATTSAMLYTQNLAALYLVAQGLALLILFRRKTLLIRAALLWASSLLLWSPLLVIFLQQAAGNTFFDKPSILLLLDSFVAYGGADKAHNGQPFALLALAQPYFVLGLGLAVWLGLSNLRERRAERTYLLLFWLVPLSLCWLISQIKPIYADRAFLASSFPFFIILGAAFNRFDSTRPRVFKCFWGPLLGGGLALLLSVAALVGLNTGGYAHDDLRGLGRDAAVQLAGPNQARFLLQFNGNSPIIFNHYTPPGSPANLADYNQATEKLLEAAGAGRICAISSTSTELLAGPRAAYQRFGGWLAARSRQQSFFRQNYPDESLQLQCWDYQT